MDLKASHTAAAICVGLLKTGLPPTSLLVYQTLIRRDRGMWNTGFPVWVGFLSPELPYLKNRRKWWLSKVFYKS